MNVTVCDVNEQVQPLIRTRQPGELGALSDPDTPHLIEPRAPTGPG